MYNKQFYTSPSIPAFPSKAFDNMVKKGGLNFSCAGTNLKNQIDSAFLAISNECNLNCKHCYEKHNINNGIEIPAGKWKSIISDLQTMGVSIIILTGGEPLLKFDKLIELLNFGNKNLSDFHLHTSGFSLTKEKAFELKKAGLKAAAVGLDSFIYEQQEEIRGSNSFNNAINAIKFFNEAGIMTYVNLCATKKLIRSGELYSYLDFVKSLNVSLIQLLEPRPCGGFSSSNGNELLDKEDKNLLLKFTKDGNSRWRYRKHPLIYYVAHIEGAEQLGCMMGGLSHFYIDSSGNVNPCVFMPVSFGNIMEDEFITIFSKMKGVIKRPIHAECPSITFEKSITGNNETMPVVFESVKEKWIEMFLQ